MSTDEAGKGGTTPGSPGNRAGNHGAGRYLIQLITPGGERISHPEFDPWVQDVTNEQLCSLYEDMAVVRRIDVEATALQRQGELALWPPLLGQEASQVGAGRALRDDDFVFSSYRENGVAYCRGVDL
ncbi:MAG TPA: thiamine pyrophosphate-dependent enzyme, partial [Arthrobacter sp.]|nr:thiamine pyrophosphate-dependent enzyme [Arthrobacter sp.]